MEMRRQGRACKGRGLGCVARNRQPQAARLSCPLGGTGIPHLAALPAAALLAYPFHHTVVSNVMEAHR